MKMRMNYYQPKRRIRYYFWRRPTPSATHGNLSVVRVGLLCSLLLLSSMPQLCDGLTTLLVVQNPSRGGGSNSRILPVADGRGRPTSSHAPSNPPFPAMLSFVLRSTARPNDDEKTEPSSMTQFYDGNILSQQEFERRSQLDATIQALRLQLPLTLTRPLTAVSAQSIFESNVQLTVLVADDSVTTGSSGGKIMERETQDEVSEEDEVEEMDEIKLLESREELIALSDVLVLGTSTAQQASAVLGGFGFTLNTNTNSTTTTTPSVECQIILDPSCKSLLIPWKAQVPNLFPGTTRSASSTSSPLSSSSSSTSSSAGTSNTFVGLSEFQIHAETGKIIRHRVKQVFWNGQSINGPNIGQALRALQSTMANIPMMSNNPLFRGLLADVRDGFLEQAAAAVSSSTQSRTSTTTSSTSSSSSSSNRQQPQRVAVIPVTSIQNITGFIVEQEQQDQTSFPPRVLASSATEIPLPGTEEWNEYAAAHETMVRFLDEVIPALSRTSTIASMTKETAVVPRYYFATNATLRSRRSISKNTQDGQGGSNNINNINNNKDLLQGQDSLANFFQGLSLARRSTGGSWKMQRAVVLDWKKRKIAVNYIATNSPWTITGQDVYTLADSATRPLIQDILQTELSVTTPDGGVSLDGPWLMKNLASAVERSSSSSGTTTAVAAAAMGPNVLRDLFMDVFLQQQQSQPSAVPMSSTAGTKKKKRKVSQTAAATTFYFMSDLKHSIPEMWNTTTTASSSSRNPLPPAAEYFDETVELRGYLGETLLRGSTVYNRAIGSLLATTRQSLAQKRLVLDVSSTPPPRVELTAQDKVRVTMVWAFRVPPPGVGAVAGALFPEGVAAPPSVPLTLEIVSDYSLDPDTGKVIQHKLVETRVNGQLTPGDVLSRSLQRFWKLESSSSSSSEPPSSRRISGNEDLLQSVSEAVSWLRSFSSNSGGKQ